jgi:hypothetical protein
MSNATALHAGLQILSSLLNSFHRRLHLALRLRRPEPVALAEVSRAFPGWLAVVGRLSVVRCRPSSDWRRWGNGSKQSQNNSERLRNSDAACTKATNAAVAIEPRTARRAR